MNRRLWLTDEIGLRMFAPPQCQCHLLVNVAGRTFSPKIVGGNEDDDNWLQRLRHARRNLLLNCQPKWSFLLFCIHCAPFCSLFLYLLCLYVYCCLSSVFPDCVSAYKRLIKSWDYKSIIRPNNIDLMPFICTRTRTAYIPPIHRHIPVIFDNLIVLFETFLLLSHPNNKM